VASGLAVAFFGRASDVTVGASGATVGLFGALFAVGFMFWRPGMRLVRANVGILALNLIIMFIVPGISRWAVPSVRTARHGSNRPGSGPCVQPLGCRSKPWPNLRPEPARAGMHFQCRPAAAHGFGRRHGLAPPKTRPTTCARSTPSGDDRGGHEWYRRPPYRRVAVLLCTRSRRFRPLPQRDGWPARHEAAANTRYFAVPFERPTSKKKKG
jgi:hypothetical protein